MSVSRFKWKRWLWAIGGGLLVTFAALNWFAYRHASAMMRFSVAGERTSRPERLSLAEKARILLCGINLPRPHSDLSSSSLAQDCTERIVQCAGGVRLSTWWWRGTNGAPLVILFHGYGGQKTGLMREATALHETGCAVLLVDFRGSGGSSESYTTIGYAEADDVASVTAYARDHLSPGKLFLYGQSMGAAAITRAIADGGVRVDGIILESVFDEMVSTTRHRFEAMRVPSFPAAELLVFWGGWQAGFNGLQHNPVKYAATVTCPALFLHGSDDPRARVAEARRVFNAVLGQKLFVEFPGVPHEPCIAKFPDKWKNTISQFVHQTPAPRG